MHLNLASEKNIIAPNGHTSPQPKQTNKHQDTSLNKQAALTQCLDQRTMSLPGDILQCKQDKWVGGIS
jgi:hypothetical protein